MPTRRLHGRAGPMGRWPHCNIIGACCVMDEPVAHAGGLGVWPIGLSAIEDVRRQLIGATFKLAEPSSLPPITAAELGEKSRAPASSSTSGASGSRALARLLDVARPTYAEEADDPPPKRRHRVSTYRTSCVLWAAARTIRSACASSHSRRSDARSFALPARAGGAGGPGFTFSSPSSSNDYCRAPMRL